MAKAKRKVGGGGGLPLLLPSGAGGKPYDIRERCLLFAVRLMELLARPPGTPEAQVARQQLARAGTSIGANVEEADGAVSQADKRKSLVVARKEARETRYWLRIIERAWPAVPVQAELQEATELLYILSAIISKLS